MSDGFVTSAVVFTIVMVIFHILKDILLQGRKITADTRARINKRWLISLVVGLGFLFLLYSCTAEKVKIDVVCTEIYQPVCWKGKLYPNACYAERDGADNKDITPSMCIDYEPGYTGEMEPCPFCPK